MADVNTIKEDLNNLFKPLTRKWNLINSDYKRPLTEITQSFKEIILDVNLPDMLKKDVKLNYNNNTLEIIAEKRKGKGFYVSVDLPAKINIDKAKMYLKRGKLTLIIPKFLKTSGQNR